MKPDTMRARERAQTLEQDARLLERLATANESLMQDKARLETETVKLQKDVAALSAGIGAYRMLRDAERGQGTFTRALTQIDAWERASGHLAESKETPQPGPPALLDLRTLKVGDTIEFLEEMTPPGGRAIAIGERATIIELEPPEYVGALPVRIKLTNGRMWWVYAEAPARVVAKPEPLPQPAPEPFRAGLPALALRRAHREWMTDADSLCHFDADTGTHYYDPLLGKKNTSPTTYKTEDSKYSVGCFRPHGATWAEVEHKAARLLGSENKHACPCEDCRSNKISPLLIEELGITDPTRDLTALWAAFREGQKS